MSGFRVVPVSADAAEHVRRELRDAQYGHPAHVEVAKGYGPCRQCLRKFTAGQEKRILFTHNAFAGIEPYPAPGPVFIHEERCASYPADGGFPEQLSDLPLTFEGYGKGRRLLHEERTQEPTAVDPVIERLFGFPEVDYVHVRNTEAGCFLMRLERR